MSSISRFLSASSGSGKGARVQARYAPTRQQQSHIAQVKDKIKEHPDLKDCSESQLDELALRLSKPHELLTYFSCSAEEQGGVAMLGADREPLLKTDRAERRLTTVEDLPVMLFLSKVNVGGSRAASPIAKLFEMEYGPLHSVLQVGNQILEWNTTSLVVPHGTPIHDPPTTTIDEGKPLPPIHPEQPDTRDKVELIPKASNLNRVEKLVGIIANYNSYKYYHPILRNGQGFVREAVAAMGYEDPPQLNSRLAKYLEQLKVRKKKVIPNYFETHEQLDVFVHERMQQFTPQDKEYCLFSYFQFHIASKTESKDPESWVCDVENCQWEQLERDLDIASLLLNQFLRVREGHTVL